jgi:hypothetical protein
MMNFKMKSILCLAAVGALGLSTSANAAALLHLEVLGSTDGGNSYESSVSVANNTQIQFEVVAQAATAGTANGTKSTNGTTDGLNALPSFSLTDGSGTFNSDALASLFNSPPSASAGTINGSTISGIITSAGSGNYPSIDGNGAVILTGAFTTGTETTETVSAGLSGSTNGTAKFSGSLTSLLESNSAGFIDFSGLTITAPETSPVPAPSVLSSLSAVTAAMFGFGALRRRYMTA